MASAGARLTDLDDVLWQNEQVQRALLQGCQDRGRLLLYPLVEEALLLVLQLVQSSGGVMEIGLLCKVDDGGMMRMIIPFWADGVDGTTSRASDTYI